MATFNKLGVTSETSEAGTNGKKLFNELLSQFPDWEIVEVSADTTTEYAVYFRMLGNTDIVHFFKTSSYLLCYGTYYKHLEGTIIIADEPYKQYAYESQKMYINSTNTTRPVYIINEPGVYQMAAIQYSSTVVYWTAAKYKDYYTSEEIIGVLAASDANSPNKLSLSTGYLKDGAILPINLGTMYASGGNNAYTRMHPIYAYGTGFFGNLLNPELFYYGYSAGVALPYAPFTEFSVAGVKFVTLNSGWSIRIDD